MPVIETYLNNEEYILLKELCEREGKSIYRKAREILQEYLAKTRMERKFPPLDLSVTLPRTLPPKENITGNEAKNKRRCED